RLAIAAVATDVVLVVQGGVFHDDSADSDGPETRHGRQRAGAADLDVDGQQFGRRLLRREFVRDGPAGASGAEAEAILEGKVVDLVDDAVDVVLQRGALFLDGAVRGECGVNVIAHFHQRVDRKAPASED